MHYYCPTMEKYFARTTRFRDLYLEANPDPQFDEEDFPSELDLTGRWQDFLESGCTWTDFLSFVRNQNNKSTTTARLVWMAPDTFVTNSHTTHHLDLLQYEHLVKFRIPRDDGREILREENALRVWAPSTAQAGATFDQILQLFTVSEVPKINLVCDSPRCLLPVSAPKLSHFLRQRKLKLQELSFSCLTLDEDHVRALETTTQQKTQIKLSKCRITSAGMIALTG